MKWWIFGHDKDKQGGYKIIGQVETVIEDRGEATQRANVQQGYDRVNYVEKAQHTERDSFGRGIVVDD